MLLSCWFGQVMSFASAGVDPDVMPEEQHKQYLISCLSTVCCFLKQDLREWSADDLSKMTKSDLKKIGYLMGLDLDMKKQKKWLVWAVQEAWDDTWTEQDYGFSLVLLMAIMCFYKTYVFMNYFGLSLIRTRSMSHQSRNSHSSNRTRRRRRRRRRSQRSHSSSRRGPAAAAAAMTRTCLNRFPL